MNPSRRLSPLLILSLIAAVSVTAASAKVRLELYYESLCPYCSNFIVNYLPDLFTNGLISAVDLKLSPYGNAKVSSDGSITCQHGEKECLLNTIEACAIDAWPDLNTHFQFIHCVESMVFNKKFSQWETCFDTLGLQRTPVDLCYANGLGKKLEIGYANETAALKPPHQYVPWVVVDGTPLYDRSTETVSRHFHQVLRAIISLDDIFLKQPTGLECPPEIRNNLRFWPFFQDCVGAIDGSHFRVKVSNNDVQRYRGRKCFPTQNVLAACSFDLKFTYILPGWEGSASDSRILNDSLTREEDRLLVPRGKYYLVDAGYQLKTGFLAPFRGKRYHLKEYSIHQPQDLEELFNLRHASLRNTIERAFGVLKKRFPMLASGSETFYNVDTQGDIIVAGCILHNYLMGMDPIDSLIEEVDRELMNEEIPPNSRSSLTNDCREGEIWRMQIATDMWQNYNVH